MRTIVGITAATVIALMLLPGIVAAEEITDLATLSVGLSVVPHAEIQFNYRTEDEEIELEEIMTGLWQGVVDVTSAANAPYQVSAQWAALERDVYSSLLLDDASEPSQHPAGHGTNILEILAQFGSGDTVDTSTGNASADAPVFRMVDDGGQIVREDVGIVRVTLTLQNTPLGE